MLESSNFSLKNGRQLKATGMFSAVRCKIRTPAQPLTTIQTRLFRRERKLLNHDYTRFFGRGRHGQCGECNSVIDSLGIDRLANRRFIPALFCWWRWAVFVWAIAFRRQRHQRPSHHHRSKTDGAPPATRSPSHDLERWRKPAACRPFAPDNSLPPRPDPGGRFDTGRPAGRPTANSTSRGGTPSRETRANVLTWQKQSGRLSQPLMLGTSDPNQVVAGLGVVLFAPCRDVAVYHLGS